ncbi:MAG: hypothetical protein WA837_02960 [Xanthobacteraceae bacterium]
MSSSTSGPDEYVGYASPPKRSQFKIGNREHLKRKRKQKGDLAGVVQSFLETLITYRDGNKLKRAPRIDVWLKKLQSEALMGDLGAIAQLMNLRENSKLLVLRKLIVYMTEAESKF